MNRVLDYIQDHLSEELSLDTLAKVACFSPHHFHRIFRSLAGEPLGQFIKRVRLERAATHLSLAPHRTVTEVALDAGFTSPAAFARAFRDRFGMSASEWRACTESKNGKAIRKTGNAGSYAEMYFEPGAWAPRWRLIMKTRKMKVDVEVKELPECTVAYIRHQGPYQGDAALFGRLFHRLAEWAGARGLMGPDAQFLSLYHDDPGVTEADKLRVMCCCVVPPDTEVDGEIGKTTVAGGTYGVGHFELQASDYGAAWDAMYGDWLPKSGYQPDDRPSVEFYRNDPESDPEHRHIVDICLPVKPL